VEIIVNIYLIIENNFVVAFKAKGYKKDGSDESKIKFLKEQAVNDYESAYTFDAPSNKHDSFMKYYKFAKLEKRGMHYKLFENIFSEFDVPENPLICVTPVVDGKIMGD
jgi:hypothetical protein